MSLATKTWVDRSGEISKTQVNFVDPSGNAFDWTAYAANVSGLFEDMEALSDCFAQKEQTGQTLELVSPLVYPTVGTAQRELALKFFYQDDVTGKKYSFTIPGPIASILPVGTDQIALDASADVISLIANFEAVALSEIGNAVTVYDIRLVGRRS